MEDNLLKDQIQSYKPHLIYNLKVSNESIIIEQNGVDLALESEIIDSKDMLNLLKNLDGQKTILEIHKSFPQIALGDFLDIIKELDKSALINNLNINFFKTGIEALLDLEDLLNDLLYSKIYQDTFWKKCQQESPDIPKNVLYGMAIEHYYFLTLQTYFDSPILGIQTTGKIHELMMEFFHDEYRHDKIILKALNSIGINEQDLKESMPLPSTLALCNALAFWSRNDPYFFFLILGTLEGKDLAEDTYIEVCKRIGLEQDFVKPIEAHANVNLTYQHGNLTRLIFKEIPHVDEFTFKHLKSQTHLFVEMYSNFYRDIWNHYSTTPSLLRNIYQ